MAGGIKRLKAETVIVGSGPGGAAVARELALRGKDVLIIERGAYHREGGWLNTFRMADRALTLASIEGTQMVRLLTVGGSTLSYLGTAFEPPAWLKERHGIDLSA